MRSNAAEQVIDGKLTRLLAGSTWGPMVTVQFVAVIEAVRAGWMAVRAKGDLLTMW